MSCPVCGEDTVMTYRPFCSRRCADIDLGKWLNEGYAIPASDPETEESVPATEDQAPHKKH